MKKLITVYLMMAMGFVLQAQNGINTAFIPSTISEYEIPLSRNGLSITSFLLTPRVNISRFEKSSTIILDIKRQMGTAKNQNPSFRYRYNYNGKQYGNETLGKDAFNNITTSDITYEVMVSYGSKSWGWTKVDGMTNQFGPVDKDAKASEVTVWVRVVGVVFNGTSEIENKIRALLKSQQAAIDAEALKKKEAEAAEARKIAEAKKLAEEAEVKKIGDAEKDLEDKNEKEKSANTPESSISSTSAENIKKEKSAQELADNTSERDNERINKEEERQRREEERKEREMEIKRQRQQGYDTWKAQKQQELQQSQAQAAESTITFFSMLGPIIYQNMGVTDTYFVFKPHINKPQFYMGFDLGFSFTYIPIIYNSDFHTMVNGEDVYRKELKPLSVYSLNLGGAFKIGVEHNNFNAHAFFAPKAGLSPLLDGFNTSILNYGGQAAAGTKYFKAFAEYGMGIHNFSSTSSNVEDVGKGEMNSNYTRLTYGLKITTNPDSYERDHLYLGMITEKTKVSKDYSMFHPEKGILLTDTISDEIKGYTFHWKKDHNFHFYINLFPNYWYMGKFEPASGNPSSEFKTRKTDAFFEVGFIRSWDFFLGGN